MKVLFILIVTIGNQEVDQSCEQALCFQSIDRCLYFADRINNQPKAPEVKAHCQHINADRDSRWYK
jgi:hypothetical protein